LAWAETSLPLALARTLGRDPRGSGKLERGRCSTDPATRFRYFFRTDFRNFLRLTRLEPPNVRRLSRSGPSVFGDFSHARCSPRQASRVDHAATAPFGGTKTPPTKPAAAFSRVIASWEAFSFLGPLPRLAILAATIAR
jgi:hypothetical protein